MTTIDNLHFVLARHDGHCPARETQRITDCCCEPIYEATSQEDWLAAVMQTRRERRAAQRAAAKALREARRA